MTMVKIEQDAAAHATRDVASAKHERFEQFINAAQKHAPIAVAVAPSRRGVDEWRIGGVPTPPH